MARVTGSHLICKALKLEGVKNIFGLAGDHILPLLDVMADQDFRIIDTRHEQAAVHMADAWSRLTEQPGVCMYTTPGFRQCHPRLDQCAAYRSADPIDRRLRRYARLGARRTAGDRSGSHGRAGDQRVVHGRQRRRIPEFIARAMRLAFSGRRGPVHLTIPIDIQEQSVEEDEVVFIERDGYRPKAPLLTDPERVRKAIALLNRAERPLLIAGRPPVTRYLVNRCSASSKRPRLPLVTEEQSRGIVGDDHPYVFGYFERGLNRAAAKVRDADVVVLLGRKQDFIIGFCRPPHVAANAKIIQIDPSPLEIGRNRGVDVGIVGDVTSILTR